MPNSQLFLRITAQQMTLKAEIPMPEMELALDSTLQTVWHKNPQTLVTDHKAALLAYLQKHIQVFSMKNEKQPYTITDLRLDTTSTPLNGDFLELRFTLMSNKSESFSPRDFVLKYDAVIHQVANHFAVVKIADDFQNGITAHDSVQIGVIQLDIAHNVVQPFRIKLSEGSNWNGFKSMFWLGIRHIREGTDHILFLILLLLPALQTIDERKWAQFKGARPALVSLFKLVTAFTVGHSISLFWGALQIVNFPAQPIEIAIAITILLTAIHAFHPIFAGKEIAITAFFGVIHGLAFSTAIDGLHLSTEQLALSILGFNMGIEAMQLAILAIVLPVLLILCKYTNYYTIFRNISATLAIIAALGWLIERVTENSNITTRLLSF